MCKDAGIKTSFNKRCANCYADALLLLQLHYGVRVEDEDVLTPSGNFIFHNGSKKVVWWYKHHYYELTAQTDDETIERYMAVHPLQTHYSRVVKDEAEGTSESGAESDEQSEVEVVDQPQVENVAEGENNTSNEGEQVEGDNGTEGNSDEKNE